MQLKPILRYIEHSGHSILIDYIFTHTSIRIRSICLVIYQLGLLSLVIKESSSYECWNKISATLTIVPPLCYSFYTVDSTYNESGFNEFQLIANQLPGTYLATCKSFWLQRTHLRL